jgi:hypothetical protein
VCDAGTFTKPWLREQWAVWPRGGISSMAAEQRASAPQRMTAVLREMTNSPGIITAPGVYDPIKARTAEASGFRGLRPARQRVGLCHLHDGT